MLKLMFITNDPVIALGAEKAGVDRIFIDLETIGKAERQGGMDTVQSKHTIADVLVIGIGEHLEHGPEQDLQIEPERHVPDVPHVELYALRPRHFLAAVNLRPACDAGTEVEHMLLMLGVLGILPRVICKCRARSYPCHIALEYVYHLGQLIDAGLAEDIAHLCDARVIVVRVNAAARVLCTYAH